MKNYKFKYAVKLFALSTLVSAVGGSIAWVASRKLNINFNDALFLAGMFIIVIGCFSLMQGTPSGASLASLGQNNAKSSDNSTLEAISTQYKSPEYAKNFKNDRILKINTKGAVLLLGGIALVVYNVLTTL